MGAAAESTRPHGERGPGSADGEKETEKEKVRER